MAVGRGSLYSATFAAQVLSASLANVLKIFGAADAVATANCKLCEMVDGLFECVCVRILITAEHQRRRNSII